MTPRAEMKLFLLLVAPNTAEKVPLEKKNRSESEWQELYWVC